MLGGVARFEDLLVQSLGDSLAAVGDGDHGRVVLLEDADLQPSFPAHGVDGVLDQVLDHPAVELRVQVDVDGLVVQGMELELDLLEAARADVVEGRAGLLDHVVAGQLGHGSDLGEAVGDGVQAADVLLDLAHGLLVGVLHPQQRHPSQKRGQRGPDLVGRLLGHPGP